MSGIETRRPRQGAKTKLNINQENHDTHAQKGAIKSPTEQLSFADIEPGGKIDQPRRKVMQYTYTDTPAEPTGSQNKFVLKRLRMSTNGITTVELNTLGVVDPRARIRDLRELGWRIETVRKSPLHIGRYVLLHNTIGGL